MPAPDASRLEMSVRDYECDVQGIANNAVYLNYLEHARHQHLLRLGVDFVEMARRGFNMVVTRIEADYIIALRAGDQFAVVSSMERFSRLRFAFLQDILLSDGRTSFRAKVIGTVVDPRGRPVLPPEVDALLPQETA
jgi:acyl-CoA thioester hydrolase